MNADPSKMRLGGNWSRLWSLISLSLGFVMLVGCSRIPKVSDAEKYIQENIRQNAGGRITLLSFQKTNATEGELAGVKFYAMELSFQIEFTDDCKWLASGIGVRNPTLATSPQTGPRGGQPAQLLESISEPGTFVKKGQRFGLSGILHFEKKENGWSPETLELRIVNPVEPSSSGQLLKPASAKLLAMENSANEQWQQVALSYKRRSDLLPDLLQTVAGSSADTGAVKSAIGLVEKISSSGFSDKTAPIDQSKLNEFASAQDQLGDALTHLLTIASDNARLKSNANFQMIDAQLEGGANRISVERERYNQLAIDYNKQIEQESSGQGRKALFVKDVTH
ncbi:MAG TPA: LemA family protein [Lacunisphaera sp.]|jgi:hypothetical protein